MTRRGFLSLDCTGEGVLGLGLLGFGVGLGLGFRLGLCLLRLGDLVGLFWLEGI